MTIQQAAFAGKSIPCRVIDAHTHIGPYNLSGWHQHQTGTGELVRQMDRMGIDAIVTAPHPMVGGQMQQANKVALQAALDYPGRVYGYISIVPWCGLDEVRAEIQKYGTDPHFLGMKFLTGYHGEVMQPEYEYAMDFAEEMGAPVLCHCWGEAPRTEGFEQATRTRHRMKLILAHQGGASVEATNHTAPMIRDRENVYLELCGSLYNRYGVEDLVELVGAEKVIFGTDGINLDPKYELGRVALAPVEDRVKEMLFAGNYLRLLEGSRMGKI